MYNDYQGQNNLNDIHKKVNEAQLNLVKGIITY
jgi:hypothetical protein